MLVFEPPHFSSETTLRGPQGPPNCQSQQHLLHAHWWRFTPLSILPSLNFSLRMAPSAWRHLGSHSADPAFYFLPGSSTPSVSTQALPRVPPRLLLSPDTLSLGDLSYHHRTLAHLPLSSQLSTALSLTRCAQSRHLLAPRTPYTQLFAKATWRTEKSTNSRDQPAGAASQPEPHPSQGHIPVGAASQPGLHPSRGYIPAGFLLAMEHQMRVLHALSLSCSSCRMGTTFCIQLWVSEWGIPRHTVTESLL